MIGSEIMKLFYKKIHSKMYKKKINYKKKIRLNFFDKVLIFLNFLLGEINYKKNSHNWFRLSWSYQQL